uniref:Peptidase S10 domain containing protein n=1 Tax=Haemonchus contortus TaxID=6289 RepID=A0A7I4Y6X6_HAECO
MFLAKLICPFAFCQAKEIKQLPGVGFELNFKHYSGFFQVSDTHLLHYWFVESQNEPYKDPLIFWFNGGPGCSSLEGLLKDMGPYSVNFDGKSLRENPYSWNKMASVVYIESPAGVGYSYSTDGNITTNDDQTSLENYEAVKLFFQGIALGNGWVHEKLNIDTSIRYAYGHGIVDEKTWNTVQKDCCKGCIDTCDLTQVTGHCATMLEDIYHSIWFDGLNPFDLFGNCDSNPTINNDRTTHMLQAAATRFKPFELSEKKTDDLMSFVRAEESKNHFLCENNTNIVKYVNDAEVRKALNIPSNLPKWDICSTQVTNAYKRQYGDMTPFIKKIVAASVRVLLFYGDTDMACNFMMGQKFVDQLGLKQTLGRAPWRFDRQIAGFKTVFEGLTFITVRGAGHKAARQKAPQMYYAIQQFLLNHPI